MFKLRCSYFLWSFFFSVPAIRVQFECPLILPSGQIFLHNQHPESWRRLCDLSPAAGECQQGSNHFSSEWVIRNTFGSPKSCWPNQLLCYRSWHAGTKDTESSCWGPNAVRGTWQNHLLNEDYGKLLGIIFLEVKRMKEKIKNGGLKPKEMLELRQDDADASNRSKTADWNSYWHLPFSWRITRFSCCTCAPKRWEKTRGVVLRWQGRHRRQNLRGEEKKPENLLQKLFRLIF